MNNLALTHAIIFIPLFFFFVWMDKKLFGQYHWQKNALSLLSAVTLANLFVYWVMRR